ncbi:hypothetical protein H6G17_24525 [Chroococcidiopsis sp. FACHB-1243]|uniref:hypothetical protein n=1 Tax=Chroococcidiopsis sp. [FACHB-1243] TaxID=2692781 RepID=UPI00177DEF4C|nr:hypothetical protein [Chroococcidiopsis sp. [FACHB-1243]]MBD2308641.1 hypothetical protein [Chroococcidiopsis sp. [FACHB-1243]]
MSWLCVCQLLGSREQGVGSREDKEDKGDKGDKGDKEAGRRESRPAEGAEGAKIPLTTPYTPHPIHHAPRRGSNAEDTSASARFTTYHAPLITSHTKSDRALLLQKQVVVCHDR